MSVIAVAGGSSPSLGRCIVSSIPATKRKPVILSRTRPDSKSSPQCHGAEVRYVRKIPGPDWHTYQLNLLNAARKAGVKRFAPAEFETGPLATGMVEVTAFKGHVWTACEESGLECARFCCGMFMNYLAFGTSKVDLRQGLLDTPIMWFNKSSSAALPIKADGTFPSLTLTEISDGKFIAAACELLLGSWEPTMGMGG